MGVTVTALRYPEGVVEDVAAVGAYAVAMAHARGLIAILTARMDGLRLTTGTIRVRSSAVVEMD